MTVELGQKVENNERPEIKELKGQKKKGREKDGEWEQL